MQYKCDKPCLSNSIYTRLYPLRVYFFGFMHFSQKRLFPIFLAKTNFSRKPSTTVSAEKRFRIHFWQKIGGFLRKQCLHLHLKLWFLKNVYNVNFTLQIYNLTWDSEFLVETFLYIADPKSRKCKMYFL